VISKDPNSRLSRFTPHQYRVAAAAGAVILALACCGTASAAADHTTAASKTYTVRFNLQEAPGTQEYDYATHFADLAATYSHHQLVFKIYPNAVLGTQSASIAQLQSNTYQIVDDTYTAADVVVPDVDVQTLPGVWTSVAQWNGAWNGGKLGQFINKQLEAKGIVGLGSAYLGNQDIVTNKPITSVSDMAGLKIRVLTGPYLALAARQLGMTPVNVNVSELVTSVGTGLITAIAQADSTLYSSKRYQVFKYVSHATFYAANIGFLASASWFKSLPKDLQTDLLKAGNIASDDVSLRAIQNNNYAARQLTKLGLHVSTLSKAQQALMTSKITAPVLALWRKKNGNTALDMALAQK
jgi:TRAP-type transport system periplasmic protein